MSQDQSSVIPNTVAIRFPTRRCSGTVINTVPTYYLKSIPTATLAQESPLSILQLNASGQVAASGFPGTKYFHETALGLFNVGGTSPTNKTSLDNLTQQFGEDWVNWQAISFDIVYDGICVPGSVGDAEGTVSGYVDEYEFCYRKSDVYSRFRTGPYNADPEELMHADPANSGCVDTGTLVTSKTPCVEVYGPPVSCNTTSLKVSITRYLVCIVDGRLVYSYVSTDTIQ
jgi:hypothetical protein